MILGEDIVGNFRLDPLFRPVTYNGKPYLIKEMSVKDYQVAEQYAWQYTLNKTVSSPYQLALEFFNVQASVFIENDKGEKKQAFGINLYERLRDAYGVDWGFVYFFSEKYYDFYLKKEKDLKDKDKDKENENDDAEKKTENP